MTKRKRAAKDLDRDNALLPQVNIKLIKYLSHYIFLEKTLPPASPCESIFWSLSSLSIFTSYRRLVSSLSSVRRYRSSPRICRYRLWLWWSFDQSCSNIPKHSYAWFVQTSHTFHWLIMIDGLPQAWKFVFKSHNTSMIESQHSALLLL